MKYLALQLLISFDFGNLIIKVRKDFVKPLRSDRPDKKTTNGYFRRHNFRIESTIQILLHFQYT